MGKRLVFGLLKGLVIGGAIGALFHFALGVPALTAAWQAYLLYAGVGAVSGVFAGRAPWQQGAWVAAILKGVFGLVVGAVLFALGKSFLPALTLPLPGAILAPLAMTPVAFAPMLAAVYAMLVELDDGGEEPEPAATTKVRAGKIALEDIDVGEDEEPAQAAKPAKGAKKS